MNIKSNRQGKITMSPKLFASILNPATKNANHDCCPCCGDKLQMPTTLHRAGIIAQQMLVNYGRPTRLEVALSEATELAKTNKEFETHLGSTLHKSIAGSTNKILKHIVNGTFIQLDNKCENQFRLVTRTFTKTVKRVVEMLRAGQILQDQLVAPCSEEARKLREQGRYFVPISKADYAIALYEPANTDMDASEKYTRVRQRVEEERCAIDGCQCYVELAPGRPTILFCEEHMVEWNQAMGNIGRVALFLYRDEQRCNFRYFVE